MRKDNVSLADGKKGKALCLYVDRDLTGFCALCNCILYSPMILMTSLSILYQNCFDLNLINDIERLVYSRAPSTSTSRY